MSTVSKGRGGRPSRAAGEKLHRTSFSLRPSAALGLELLSRQQIRSQSQVVEALALAECARVELGTSTTFRTLADLVEGIGNLPEALQLMHMAEHAPQYVPYPYRVAGSQMATARANILTNEKLSEPTIMDYLKTFEDWCVKYWPAMKAHLDESAVAVGLQELAEWESVAGDPEGNSGN